MLKGAGKLGTNACKIPLFTWDHTCPPMHELPLVPSMKLLETARSPRCQEAPENWEQRQERCLCSHGTMHQCPLVPSPELLENVSKMPRGTGTARTKT